MSEYNIQMNKYNALNAGYDQLYPATKIKNVDGLDTALQSKPNPNLLDNWYFGNPVNQRGQTVYTSNAEASVYSIDRWKIWGQYTSSDTLSLNDGYVTFNSNGHRYGGITTTIESAGLRGETLTLSIFGRGRTTGRAAWLTVDSYDASDVQTRICDTYINFDTIFSIIQRNGLVVPSNSVTLQIKMLSSNDDGGIYDFKAIKLELGDTQTLAHQENGNWVLNEIPDYGEQLRRCQRYCFVWDYGNTSNSCLAVFQAYTATNAFGIIPTPVTLRANPVVSGGTLVAGGKTVTLTGITKCANGVRTIAVVSDGNLTVGQAVGIENGNDNGRVVFSADL